MSVTFQPYFTRETSSDMLMLNVNTNNAYFIFDMMGIKDVVLTGFLEPKDLGVIQEHVFSFDLLRYVNNEFPNDGLETKYQLFKKMRRYQYLLLGMMQMCIDEHKRFMWS